MQVPNTLRAGGPEVAGDDPLHAHVDGSLENRLLLEDRLRGDCAQEDVHALEILRNLSGRVSGVVTDANVDAARAQGIYVRLGG